MDRAVRESIERLIAKHGGLNKAAKALDISGAYLSDIKNGRREVSKRMARKLGLRRSYEVIA